MATRRQHWVRNTRAHTPKEQHAMYHPNDPHDRISQREQEHASIQEPMIERDRAIEIAIRDIGHTLEDVIDCILVNETHVPHRRELLDHKDHIREALTTLCHTLNGAPS